MRSVILNTLLLVAVGSQPVIAANCVHGACEIERPAKSEVLIAHYQTPESDIPGSHVDPGKTSEALSRKIDSYLNNEDLKINNESTRKGPGNSTQIQPDELAPIRQLKAIRPELVLTPMLQPVISGTERLA